MKYNEVKKRTMGKTLLPLLGACVVCMNAIKYMFPQIRNYMFYSLYIAFIIVGLFVNSKYVSKMMRMDIAILFGLFIVIDLYALVTLVWGGSEAINSYIEFTATIFICYVVLIMDNEDLKSMSDWIIVIASIYSLFILLFGKTYQNSSQNYLSITLPIGLSLSLMLARIVVTIYEKRVRLIPLIGYVGLVALNYITLIQFTARGSLLFPIIVMLCVCIAFSSLNKSKTIVVLGICAVFFIIGYRLFETYASEYILGRMMRLFQDNSSESRWFVWGEAINYISENKLYIIGAGINGFVNNLGFYPHNLYLQIIGEYGFIGVILSVYATSLIIKYQVRLLPNKKTTMNLENDKFLLVTFISGLLYFFLCFMKSFRIYEIYPMMIFYMAIIGIYNRSAKHEQYEKQCNNFEKHMEVT